MKQRVLFVDRDNTCLSQMAEGLLEAMEGGDYKAFSAGTSPGTRIDPLAVAVLRETLIDISTQEPKDIRSLAADEFDQIVLMRHNDLDTLPPFAGNPVIIRWNFEDLKSKQCDALDPLYFYRRTREEIKARLCLWHEIECRQDLLGTR